MAEDTRDGNSTPSSTPKNKPKHDFPKSQVGKLWDAFGNPEEPINVLPGATYDPSREKPKELTMSQSLSSITMKDFSNFHRKPCARDSLMLGMGAGFGIGGIRGIVGGFTAIWPACNWAVGTFAITSIISYEFCQRRRVNEVKGMKEAVELMQQLKVKKEKETEQLKAAREAEAATERKQKSWTNLSNYKFW
ncbi:hypothetical protein BGW36DRAFT_302255 [Talaromyces proteolyticus]|uniref:Cytochrome c oxidase assembly protein COX20, mitochondrial n=1 Tax=Talaromyces proteolyticus TaxID=1131652 RepID=A0AAD4PTB1_9EURO|nr:uncharacterized protein BGW36DRAFT_302255 [Talaromyces proteolyticus]KAH8693015.1 hypothetical protein BGW36DRAFT_302255 [Talaromyces proteolyticus]